MTDVFGRNVPAGNESADVPGAFTDYSLSAPPGPLTVGSRAEANAVWAAYVAAVGSGNAKPMHVWRTDINQEERRVGDSWEYVAGRQHGAKLRFARTGVPQSPSGPLVLYATEFLRASPGWTMSSAQNLVIPQTGLYTMYCDINIAGSAGNLGRTFFQYSTTNGAISARHTVTNENNLGGTAIWDFNQGDELRIQVYHEGGGARDYTATMLIAMVNAPNW